MAKEYWETVFNELREPCDYVLDLLDKYLFPKASNAEPKLYNHKKKGEYYSYLAEVATGDSMTIVHRKHSKMVFKFQRLQ